MAAKQPRHRGLSAAATTIVLAVFLVLGPLIGGLALSVLVALGGPLLMAGDEMPATLLMSAVVVFVPAAYVAGGVQALATAIAVIIYANLVRSQFPWQVPFWASGISALVYVLTVGANEMPALAFAIVAGHLVAGVACWHICQRLLGR